jgi:hypothetical protein
MSSPLINVEKEQCSHSQYPIIPNDSYASIERWQLPALLATSAESFSMSWLIQGVKSLTSSSIAKLKSVWMWKNITGLEVPNKKYGNPEDPFHKEITNVIWSLEVMKRAKYGPKEIEHYLNDHSTYQTPSSVLDGLYNFKEHFPELFAKQEYQRDIDFLEKEMMAKYGAVYSSPLTPREDYTVIRPLSVFTGDRLVFGCGEALEKGCHGHPKNKDYVVNINLEDRPDLVADYKSNSFWKEFPKEYFNEIFMEGFCPAPRFSSLTQMARILKDNGKVRLPLNIYGFVHALNPEAFSNFVKTCGFSHYEIRTEHFRSCGVDDDKRMLILFKNRGNCLNI